MGECAIMKIHEYFKNEELACRCGCGFLPNKKSVERLYRLRLLVRVPMLVISGARCEDYNTKIGGKIGSIHLPHELRKGPYVTGAAFDISFATITNRMQFFDAAIECGFKGFGFRSTSLHIDDAERSRIMIWGY